MFRRIVCSISGVALNEDDETVLEEMSPTDEAPELPVGWTRITLESRSLNPSYEAIQFVKAGLIQQILSQVPPDQHDEHEDAVAIQIDAQYAALEACPENVATLLNKVEVYVAPPERVPGLDKELEKVFAVFGLEVSQREGDEDDDEEEEEDSESSDQTVLEAPSAAPGTARRRRRKKA
jgi:hypothetical protein|tara:strand:- start:3572 stop:4108 length:537 start_codon:yes stop_codon:yes gene_type:complete